MAKQNQKTIQKRIDELTKLQFVKDPNAPLYILQGNPQIQVNQEAIDNETSGNWKALVEKIQQDIDAAKEAIQGEHLTQDQTPKDVAVIGVRNADTDIATLDMNDAIIAEWKEKYSGITVADISDKENIIKLQEAKKFIRGKRTSLETKRKSLKQFYIDEGKKIDAAAGKYSTQIEDIEKPLDDELEKYEKMKKADEERKEQEAQAELTRRVDALKAAGMQYNGNYYVIGDTMSMDVVTIKSLSAFDFDALVLKVGIEKKRLDDIAEEQRKKQEEDLKILKEQRLALRSTVAVSIGLTFSETVDSGNPGYFFKNDYEDLILSVSTITDTDDGQFTTGIQAITRKINEAKQKVVDAADKKIQDERDQLRREKLQMREQMATNIGLTFNPSTLCYVFKNDHADIILSKSDMESMENGDFSAKIEEYKERILDARAKAHKDQQVKEERQNLINNRLYDLKVLGMIQQGNFYVFPGAGKISISLEDVHNDETWKASYISLDDAIHEHVRTQDDLKKRQADLERKQSEQLEQRTYELINLGMAKIGTDFLIKNEFGDQTAVAIEKVKAYDPDSWGNALQEISAAVARVKELTEERRAEAIRQKDALKPEITKAREYIETLLSISSPVFEDEKINNIVGILKSKLTDAATYANNSLLDCEK